MPNSLQGYFTLEIDGLQNTQFKTVSGLSRDKGIASYRAGNSPDNHPVKQLGVEEYGDLEVETFDETTITTMEEWFNTGGKKNVSLIQLDGPVGQGTELRRWDIFNAEISGSSLDDLDGDNRENVSMVTYTIALEYYRQVTL